MLYYSIALRGDPRYMPQSPQFGETLTSPHLRLAGKNGTPQNPPSFPNVVMGSYWGVPFCGSFRGSGLSHRLLFLSWASTACKMRALVARFESFGAISSRTFEVQAKPYTNPSSVLQRRAIQIAKHTFVQMKTHRRRRLHPRCASAR